MIFTSPEFIFLFLPLCCLLVGLARRYGSIRLGLWTLAVASLIFYSIWKPANVLILLGSILANYWISGLYVKRSHRKALLILALCLNLGLLFYFKYAAFATSLAAQVGLMSASWPTKVLPLGISFITFQKIAFQVDRYRGIAPHPRFTDFLSFVTFFPQLIAGPIVHHQEFIPQLAGWQPKAILAAEGCFLFAIGAAKKTLLADSLAPLADAGFSQPAGLGFLSAWATLLAYTFQIYFDFSAYSDMAVGLGLLFGVRLPWNFRSPYKSTSLIEFWRRWHMTLSRFLKDYVYFPLGGSHSSPTRTNVNLLTTMILGGIWHGAGWTFLVWGGLHGAALAIAHTGRTKNLHVPRIAGWLGTMALVMAGWVFFRSISLHESWMFFSKLGGGGSGGIVTQPLSLAGALPYLVAAAVIAFLFPNSIRLSQNFSPTIWRLLFSAGLLFLAVLMLLSRIEQAPFLYFDF
jgi:alginate O-acetyltransferase complex protein AlgI